jgi:hypothetical protein
MNEFELKLWLDALTEQGLVEGGMLRVEQMVPCLFAALPM